MTGVVVRAIVAQYPKTATLNDNAARRHRIAAVFHAQALIHLFNLYISVDGRRSPAECAYPSDLHRYDSKLRRSRFVRSARRNRERP